MSIDVKRASGLAALSPLNKSTNLNPQIHTYDLLQHHLPPFEMNRRFSTVPEQTLVLERPGADPARLPVVLRKTGGRRSHFRLRGIHARSVLLMNRLRIREALVRMKDVDFSAARSREVKARGRGSASRAAGSPPPTAAEQLPCGEGTHRIGPLARLLPFARTQYPAASRERR